PVQPRFQIARHLVGIGRQPGALKESLPSEPPLFLRKEIVVKPAKTLAVADRYVAAFQLLLELEHQCAFPRRSTGQATVHDDGGQALRDKINRRIVWKHHLLVAMLLDVDFPQHLDCLHAWRGRLSGIREEFKSAQHGRGKLPEVTLSRQGGYAHILKGYFYTNLVGTLFTKFQR